jgi:hypothetical protein
MDSCRFDSLTRTLTTAHSRRGALTAALGGAVGIWGLVHPDEAAARKKKPCPPCKKRKKDRCKPKAAGAPCTAFAGGVCQNGACVDVQGDEANCGALGTTCGSKQVCQAGSCFPGSTCPATTSAMCLGSGAFTSSCNSAVFGSDLCVCSRSAEGNVVCIALPPGGCADKMPCSSSTTCPPGQACVEVGSCCPSTGGTPARTCFARCPDPAT